MVQLFRNDQRPPPIQLLRLGELYFVADGHHRVAVARAQGWTHLPAQVRRICTVAYACSCLRAVDLPAKAAERRFLQAVPLPEAARRQLWLDRPTDWARLTDSALVWGFRRQRDHHAVGLDVDAHTLASVWWIEEVMPAVQRLREDVPTDLVDIQLYIAELARRDGVGDLSWPAQRACPNHTSEQSNPSST